MSLAASEGSRAAARRHREKGMRAAYVNPFWSNRAAGLRAGIGSALSGRNCAGLFVATRTAASHQARTMATPASVPDRAVAREFPDPRHVQHGLAGPAVPVAVGRVHLLLAVAVGPEIGKNHEWVSAGEQRVVDRGKRIVLARRPVVASQPVQYGPDLLVVPVQVPGVVAAGPQRLDLLHGHSEYEDVLVADLLR